MQSIAVDEDTDCEKEQKFDKWLKDHGLDVSRQWKRIQQGVVQPPYPCTLQTYIRNTIHHPENQENEMYSGQELKDSIQRMVEILKTLENVA